MQLSIREYTAYSEAQILPLYESVGWSSYTTQTDKATGIEPAPHSDGPVRCFLPRCPRLAPARLRPPQQKSLEYCSPECAQQFFAADFRSGKKAAAGNTSVLSRPLTQHGRKSAR